MAREAFKDLHAFAAIDARQDYDEERLFRIAMVGVLYVFIVYTEDLDLDGNEIVRIISARKATRHERRTYHEG